MEPTNIVASTLPLTFGQTVKTFGPKLALRYTVAKEKVSENATTFAEKFDQISYTWNEYNENARLFAKSLIAVGLKPKSRVTIQGSNCPNWLFANVGTILAGGVAAGVYPTNNPETSQYTAKTSKARVVVVEDEKQLAKYTGLKSTAVKCFVVWKKTEHTDTASLPAPVYSLEEFLSKGKELKHDDLDTRLDKRIEKQKSHKVCSLIYTSGTTGMPKAAALTHDNLLFTAATASKVFSLNETHQGLSYLPLSHIAAQQLDCVAPLMNGSSIDIAPPDALKGTNLKQHIEQARPTYFLAVPRVWEKFKEGLVAKLSQAPWHKRVLFNIATTLGGAAVKNVARIDAKKPEERTKLDRLIHKVSNFVLRQLDTIIFTPIKTALGLDKCVVAASGAGALDPHAEQFFSSMNIRIIDIFGMSETSGLITSQNKPLLGTEVKILSPDENGEGEIAVKGRNVFKKYFKNEEETKKAFDDQEFLLTGDKGKLDDKGDLKITGRIKELIKTSGGENIPPILIESTILNQLPILSQAVLIGDKKNYLTCLLTLKTKLDSAGSPTNELSSELTELLATLGSAAKTIQEAVNDRALQSYIEAGIKQANKKALSDAQHVQKFIILPEDFSVANNTVTATLKLRRAEIAKRYSAQIDEMYKQ